MFGLRSYDDEYQELCEYLTHEWRMKPLYAKAFLDAYKKNIGKILAGGKQRTAIIERSTDPETRLLGYALFRGEEHSLALIGQAYQAYMKDLRRGKHIGTPVEFAIWAILANRSDLLEGLDRGFAAYIEETHKNKFPNLFDEVFEKNEGEAE